MKTLLIFLIPILPSFYLMIPKSEAASLLTPSCVASVDTQILTHDDACFDDRFVLAFNNFETQATN